MDGPDSVSYAGWYTIKFNPPVRCGCGAIVEYAQCDTHHIIVVWEEKDDEHMLHAANNYKKSGLNPKVVEYEPSMGDCIEFSVAVMQGKLS